MLAVVKQSFFLKPPFLFCWCSSTLCSIFNLNIDSIMFCFSTMMGCIAWFGRIGCKLHFTMHPPHSRATNKPHPADSWWHGHIPVDYHPWKEQKGSGAVSIGRRTKVGTLEIWSQVMITGSWNMEHHLSGRERAGPCGGDWAVSSRYGRHHLHT